MHATLDSQVASFSFCLHPEGRLSAEAYDSLSVSSENKESVTFERVSKAQSVIFESPCKPNKNRKVNSKEERNPRVKQRFD